MNEALRQRLETIARRDYEEFVEEGRRVNFRVCRICGFAKWHSASEPGVGFSVALNDDAFDNESGCERCLDVYQRAPEVMRWVLGVVRHAEMTRKPQEEAAKDA